MAKNDHNAVTDLNLEVMQVLIGDVWYPVKPGTFHTKWRLFSFEAPDGSVITGVRSAIRAERRKPAESPDKPLQVW